MQGANLFVEQHAKLPGRCGIRSLAELELRQPTSNLQSADRNDGNAAERDLIGRGGS
jgi:hypothetical protein